MGYRDGFLPFCAYDEAAGILTGALVEELRRRLEGRGTDSPEAIAERLAKAEYEMTFAPQFDHVIVNDDLASAKQETLQVVKDFLGK